ncbi:C25 family cysteine peptidase [Bryobacter aggregatus]|uniref:C25 family cysteine peptidase n=1 Tax=Bryobacter aggregatus TaxID=360054 RepID=UPI0004E18AE7|nr:C25 family cysteine peptidase [Bryobacter aggregatus]
MSHFSLIRPEDDVAAQQASSWADAVAADWIAAGHQKSADINQFSPPNHSQIVSALASSVTLLCYFGHGDERSWRTNAATTVTAPDFVPAQAKAVVSIACKTGCILGPGAVTFGVAAWLGFTISVAVLSPHKGIDPIGDAIVAGLSGLRLGQTMQQCRDELYAQLDSVVTDYDTGRYSSHPNAALKYFAALAMRDHIVLHGTTHFAPL